MIFLTSMQNKFQPTLSNTKVKPIIHYLLCHCIGFPGNIKAVIFRQIPQTSLFCQILCVIVFL